MNRKVSVAPMMDCTDRHERFFLRLISKNVQEQSEPEGDDFENIYKGEVSKSGVSILPSKRARKIPEKIQISKQDIDELKTPSEPNIDNKNEQTEESVEESNVSLDELSEEETKSNEVNKEDSETSNS